MDHGTAGITRRTWLKGAALAAAGAAAGGCASLPARPDVNGVHPCSHPHCRYHVAPAEGEQGSGHCALPLRERGGRP